ncbi:carbohydrate ABC transporter permease [Truepera radiovictrix]|uniref:Binding-protein-dependent transport systems inner membrane component n=1 Tax=Truepera radiovictrix (strain DSM 17093 / CIP 108686 / LMG 22925 / RQ-24) TaxID=649638 RepID=D7CQV7_TRURR|nr:carbohydrate ABC transporter permease [Truepera radiovictrix]ADI15091.1 binding-protein-dependent transport systems inner membrane component [Truepera radiovictrix DSM 17093]WMT56356.1 carbohydrate ABC transporter permease [Truepera radiovictrix]
MVESTTARASARHRPGVPWGRILAWAALVLLLVITLLPFWVVIKTAFSSQRALFGAAGSLLPADPTLFNFRRALGLASLEEMIAAGGSGQSLNFLLYLRNSVIFTGLIVVFQIFFSAMAAYAFARLKFPGRNLIFLLYLAALMVPGIVLFIPNFVLIRQLGWLNTFQGMVAPYLLMTPFAVFFLRQFFLSLPRELEEAARLDGASPFGIFWRIVLPISQTPLATLAILTTINMWNEYFWPFLVGRQENVRVLTVGLGIFQSQTPQGVPDWTGLMAGTLLSIIPIFLLLLFLGRRIVDSLAFSGLK